MDLNLKHLDAERKSTILFHLTKHLLYVHYRQPGQPPPLHLFGQLKRIAREWMDGYLRCKDAHPAQVLYGNVLDMACERIKAAITETLSKERPVKAVPDPYNPKGSTRFVNFTTIKETRWETDPLKCHVNWAVCDRDWEAEFCRVIETHPRTLAYVKNQGLGFEVPYLLGATPKRYLPDFIVKLNASGGEVLNLVVEVKGYRGEDAKEKANTMRTYWVPGVNNLGTFGRWAFVELTAAHDMRGVLSAAIDDLLVREPA